MNLDQIITKIKETDKTDFDRMDLLKSYPEPVGRYLRYHLPKGIPNHTHAEVRLKGIIKMVNWSQFKSTLYANPFHGFVWKAKVNMGILPVKGFDYFLNDMGAMKWTLFNILPVMKSGGDDVSRSAEGRARMESAFCPHLLINPKVKWNAISENEITANWKIHREDQALHFKIGNDGSLKEIFIKRWGNPGDVVDFGYHTFGCTIESEILHNNIIIPKKGNAGWWFGEKGYDDGEFFRFEAY
jgi:hypothetical protein